MPAAAAARSSARHHPCRLGPPAAGRRSHDCRRPARVLPVRASSRASRAGSCGHHGARRLRHPRVGGRAAFLLAVGQYGGGLCCQTVAPHSSPCRIAGRCGFWPSLQVGDARCRRLRPINRCIRFAACAGQRPRIAVTKHGRHGAQRSRRSRGRRQPAIDMQAWLYNSSVGSANGVTHSRPRKIHDGG